MANLGPTPLVQFYDTDGSVLKDGTVSAYETGASITVQAMYHDTNLAIKHENPLTLGPTGSAQVYLETDTDYRFVVKNSAGTTLATIDDVEPMFPITSLSEDWDIGTNSIVSASNGDITFTSAPGRNIILDSIKIPKDDGVASSLLGTDGAGSLNFDREGYSLIDDITPQLGGNLDTNSFNIKISDDSEIRTSDGNEALLFTRVSSAVNYLNVTNSATGNAVILEAEGDDSNIDLILEAKGSGQVATSGAGMNFPASDGTIGQAIVSNGSVADWGFPTNASQADIESEVSTNRPITPAVVKHAPSLAKAWVELNTLSQVVSSYNVDFVVGATATLLTVHFTTDFSSDDYAVVGGVEASLGLFPVIASKAAGSCGVKIQQQGGTGSVGTSQCLLFYGDQ